MKRGADDGVILLIYTRIFYIRIVIRRAGDHWVEEKF
jgi:hypothetical protein